MQNMVTKKSIYFTIFFSVFFLLIHYQSHSSEFSLADSLFAQRKYTKALQSYEKVYQQGVFSASMLLKLAYLHDRVGRYDETLYYLSVYQKHYFSEEVQQKMEQMASDHQLTGYKANESDQVLIYYQQYKLSILTGLLVSCGIVFMIMVYQRQKLKTYSIGLGISFALLAIGVFLMANIISIPQKAIIDKPDTILMQGPSAASGSLEVVQNGHRVRILKQDEAWTKIFWDGNTAYLRNDKLRKI
jgi:hypothetical protein